MPKTIKCPNCGHENAFPQAVITSAIVKGEFDVLRREFYNAKVIRYAEAELICSRCYSTIAYARYNHNKFAYDIEKAEPVEDHIEVMSKGVKS